MATSHLEVIAKRGRTRMTWLWPGKMKSIEGFLCGMLHEIYK